MNTKHEFILYVTNLRKEIQASDAETAVGADAFLESLVAWLETSKEKPPEDFNWGFASKLIWAGAFYE
jgi:hypothetical protein